MTTIWNGASCAARLPAQDLDRARDFYTHRLGLAPTEERDGGFRVQLGDTELAVFRSEGAPSGTHTQLGIYVSDIDAVGRELRERGVDVQPDEPVDIAGNYASKGTGERALWVTDSEGNVIGLAQITRSAMPLRDATIGPIIAVASLERARAFYEDTLGLAGRETRGGYELIAGAGTVAYLLEQPADMDDTARLVASFRVEDVDATVDALRGLQVPFLTAEESGFELDDRGISRSEGLAVAWMRDPDGNVLTVFAVEPRGDDE